MDELVIIETGHIDARFKHEEPTYICITTGQVFMYNLKMANINARNVVVSNVVNTYYTTNQYSCVRQIHTYQTLLYTTREVGKSGLLMLLAVVSCPGLSV